MCFDELYTTGRDGRVLLTHVSLDREQQLAASKAGYRMSGQLNIFALLARGYDGEVQLSLLPQIPCAMTGRVTDADGLPLPEARV